MFSVMQNLCAAVCITLQVNVSASEWNVWTICAAYGTLPTLWWQWV